MSYIDNLNCGLLVRIILLNASSAPHVFRWNPQVKFLEEYLSKLQLDGQIFERKVYQMMRRLSVATDEDIQHTLSFLEKVTTHSFELRMDQEA